MIWIEIQWYPRHISFDLRYLKYSRVGKIFFFNFGGEEGSNRPANLTTHPHPENLRLESPLFLCINISLSIIGTWAGDLAVKLFCDHLSLSPCALRRYGPEKNLFAFKNIFFNHSRDPLDIIMKKYFLSKKYFSIEKYFFIQKNFFHSKIPIDFRQLVKK